MSLGLRVIGIVSIAGVLAWAATAAPLVPTGGAQSPGFGYGYGAGKVTICHKGKVTITVGAPAVPAHINNHGDTLGPCPPVVAASAALAGSAKPTGQSQNAPGNSGNAPGHNKGGASAGSTGPGNSGNAPGHNKGGASASSTGPGNSGNAPGHNKGGASVNTTVPGNSGNAPGHAGVGSGNGKGNSKH